MKKIYSFILFCFLSGTVFAQHVLDYESRNFVPVWYIGANIGTNLYLAEGNDFLSGEDGAKFSLKDNSGTTVRAVFGRKLTPVFGLRTFIGFNKYNWLSTYINHPVVSFTSESITADITVSLVNLLEDAYTRKKFDFLIFAGTGYQVRNKINSTASTIPSSNSSSTPIGRFGLEGDFSLSNRLNLSLGGELNYVNDRNNGLVAGKNYEVIPTFSAGLNYQLK